MKFAKFIQVAGTVAFLVPSLILGVGLVGAGAGSDYSHESTNWTQVIMGAGLLGICALLGATLFWLTSSSDNNERRY